MTDTLFDSVHIVGAGLLGTSAGLALTGLGIAVTLEDSSTLALGVAEDYGAGSRRSPQDDEPDLVIVASPPDTVVDLVAENLSRFRSAVVMDLASVKLPIVEGVAKKSDSFSRFVGSHPMAGRERGGAVSARSDLFTARPWVICPNSEPSNSVVRGLISLLGALPLEMSAEDHDRAVAQISHFPQLVSSLAAARLDGTTREALGLAGSGVRDVTRIAESDPQLWVQILSKNKEPILETLLAFKQDLEVLIEAIQTKDPVVSRDSVLKVLEAGVRGVQKLPGKHGEVSRFSSITVVIRDIPGELARLLYDLGDWGINLEDLSLEHSPGAQVGFAELLVAQKSLKKVERNLKASGWSVAGERR